MEGREEAGRGGGDGGTRVGGRDGEKVGKRKGEKKKNKKVLRGIIILQNTKNSIYKETFYI